MPAPADLVVFNQSSSSVVIQTQTIASGASYTVPFASLGSWAVDPYLRAYLLSGQVYIVALGVKLYSKTAYEWMDAIFRGSIVFGS